MNFNEIKTFIVGPDKVARPLNPFDYDSTVEYTAYERFATGAKDHHYAVDESLTPGEYDANLFLNPVHQYWDGLEWVTENWMESALSEVENLKTRLFLKFKMKENEQEYKCENFDTVEGAWDYHSRLVPESVYSPDELEYIMGEQIMFKKDFEESVNTLMQRKVIQFTDWINNNWFIPADDSMWKLDTKNTEYQRTIPVKKLDLFDSEELFNMFLNGEGEL